MSFLTGVRWRKDFFYVGNASMPRTVYDAVGGYDETYRHDLFDDWEFAQRLFAAGLAVRFVPRAIAWHDHDVTLEERLVAVRRLGECAAAYERAMPEGRPGRSRAWFRNPRGGGSGRAQARGRVRIDRRLGDPVARPLSLAFVRGYRRDGGGSASRPVAG
ncbi:MAG: hypothetical protein IPI87_20195 [Betaproteobacteria bacterium]|nr:hypothetical protein [Betaproteobacteria bacterium]